MGLGSVQSFQKNGLKWVRDITTCSLLSLAVREMQMKTTWRCHLTPVRTAETHKTMENNCWRDMGRENIQPLLVDLQTGAHILEICVESSRNFKMKSAM